MLDKNLLRNALVASMIRRWHTLPHTAPQSVGEHTFGMLWMLHLTITNNKIKLPVILLAMAHDIHESKKGDLPPTEITRIASLHRYFQAKEVQEWVTPEKYLYAVPVLFADLIERLHFVVLNETLGKTAYVAECKRQTECEIRELRRIWDIDKKKMFKNDIKFRAVNSCIMKLMFIYYLIINKQL